MEELQQLEEAKDQFIMAREEVYVTDYAKASKSIGILYSTDNKIGKKTKQVTSKDRELAELEEVVKHNQNLEEQRLDTVKDKARLLNMLINQEDIGDEGNMAIGRELKNILNN